MRCVMVNGAKLKAETQCANCGGKINDSYVREIRSRRIYCGFRCYSATVDTPITMLAYRTPTLNAWTRTS
jgi:hypothetical protein